MAGWKMYPLMEDEFPIENGDLPTLCDRLPEGSSFFGDGSGLGSRCSNISGSEFECLAIPIFFHRSHMGVSKNRGKTLKMDGL